MEEERREVISSVIKVFQDFVTDLTEIRPILKILSVWRLREKMQLPCLDIFMPFFSEYLNYRRQFQPLQIWLSNPPPNFLSLLPQESENSMWTQGTAKPDNRKLISASTKKWQSCQPNVSFGQSNCTSQEKGDLNPFCVWAHACRSSIVFQCLPGCYKTAGLNQTTWYPQRDWSFQDLRLWGCSSLHIYKELKCSFYSQMLMKQPSSEVNSIRK